MLTKTLAATAALSMLVGGGSALAAQPKSAVAAGPKQPIPYSQLNAYMKASPKARASKDWWSGSAGASTGLSTDTSATAPAADPTSSMMTPSTPTDTAVNPSPSAAPPSLPSTPPTDGAPQLGGSTMSNPSTPGDTTNSSTTPPTEPK